MSKDLIDVPEIYYPTEYMRNRWGRFLIMQSGAVSPDGWWSGWCPMHDPDGSDPEQPSAEFNFHMGCFRCIKPGEDGKASECHDLNKTGKRRKSMMSLVNLAIKARPDDAQRA